MSELWFVLHHPSVDRPVPRLSSPEGQGDPDGPTSLQAGATPPVQKLSRPANELVAGCLPLHFYTNALLRLVCPFSKYPCGGSVRGDGVSTKPSPSTNIHLTVVVHVTLSSSTNLVFCYRQDGELCVYNRVCVTQHGKRQAIPWTSSSPNISILHKTDLARCAPR